MGENSYKKAGVDIKKADAFVKKIKLDAIGRIEAFGCLFKLAPLLKKYKDPVLVSSTDGVGTKLMLARQFNIHNTVGIDLVAMNVNDVICAGAKPLFFLDYIACGKVNVKTLCDVVAGIKKGLDDSDCLLLGGETAEMPGMYRQEEYDLAGFCVGIVDKKKIIDGRNISCGDVIIGLASSGLHSNGFSLVRKILTKTDQNKYKKELLTPTRIYVKPILSLLSAIGYRPSVIKGIAHVTGGAFFRKVTKILPPGYGMYLNRGSWPVPEIFTYLQSVGAVSEQEMYTVFNMGIGMVLVVDKAMANRVLRHLNRTVAAYIIGEITDRKQGMILV